MSEKLFFGTALKVVRHFKGFLSSEEMKMNQQNIQFERNV